MGGEIPIEEVEHLLEVLDMIEDPDKKLRAGAILIQAFGMAYSLGPFEGMTTLYDRVRHGDLVKADLDAALADPRRSLSLAWASSIPSAASGWWCLSSTPSPTGRRVAWTAGSTADS